MKRSIQTSSPDSITSHSKRKDEDEVEDTNDKAQTKRQSSRSTEKYWQEKAGNLQNAFVEGGVMEQAFSKFKGEVSALYSLDRAGLGWGLVWVLICLLDGCAWCRWKRVGSVEASSGGFGSE